MSNIEPGHVRVFQAIRSQLYGNITLSSCRINGKPGVAIVMIDHVGEGKVGVMPLFVAINEGMTVEFEGENGPAARWRKCLADALTPRKLTRAHHDRGKLH